jgi:hypothetical protein
MRMAISILVAGLLTLPLSTAAFSHSTGHSGGQGPNGANYKATATKGYAQECYGMNHKCGSGPHLHGGPKGTSFPHHTNAEHRGIAITRGPLR